MLRVLFPDFRAGSIRAFIRRNRAKHGIDFDFSRVAFDDPPAITTQDRDVDGEQRYQLIGAVFTGIILVAHAVRVDPSRARRKRSRSFDYLRAKGYSGGKETL